MTKGERILVAVDGSEYCNSVVEQAISMGRICNSIIFAVHVVEIFPEALAHAPWVEEKMAKEARETLEEITNRIEQENIVCEKIIRTSGQPHKPIVEEAKENNIDLIVMGTHGKTRLKNVLVGSVAQKVIGNAPCAVMVVPC